MHALSLEHQTLIKRATEILLETIEFPNRISSYTACRDTLEGILARIYVDARLHGVVADRLLFVDSPDDDMKICAEIVTTAFTKGLPAEATSLMSDEKIKEMKHVSSKVIWKIIVIIKGQREQNAPEFTFVKSLHNQYCAVPIGF